MSTRVSEGRPKVGRAAPGSWNVPVTGLGLPPTGASDEPLVLLRLWALSLDLSLGNLQAPMPLKLGSVWDTRLVLKNCQDKDSEASRTKSYSYFKSLSL